MNTSEEPIAPAAQGVAGSIRQFRTKYEKYFPAGFFVAGFLFDVFTLGQIDHWLNLAQQFTFLALITVIMYFQAKERQFGLQVPDKLKKVWLFNNEILHFLFGSLLSAYTIFYFKSASFLSSFAFILFMIGILVINELPRFHKQELRMKVGLLALCVTSYFSYLVPILFGFVGVIPFTIGILLSALSVVAVHWYMHRKGYEPRALLKDLVAPSALVLLIFLGFYFTQLLPPVPLSLTSFGIYHDVQRTEEGQYRALHQRPFWRFWHSGDQWFEAQPGDRVFAFAEIFAPSTFEDEVRLHWLFDHPKWGWQTMDRIPLSIVGGREQGFRGYAYKGNYQPGQWQVRVETLDGREIGRIYFKIFESQVEDREFKARYF